MKTVFVAASALVLGIASASAADLAARPYAKAPPVVAAAYDWSGFYVGVNGGGGWSRTCWDALPFPINIPALGPPFNISGPEGCHTASGGTAGGQIGYRWQQASWVFGLEAQGNWADLTGSNASQLAPFFTGFANRTKTDAIGLFTGQVGYAWSSFLLYLKGGAAVVHDTYDSFLTAPQGPLPTGFVSDTGGETRWGAAVGIGGEFAFTQNWSVALEYDHLFMGNSSVHMTYDPAFIAQLNHDERIHQDIDLVTVRLDYRFGGPVVAKY
ncbi:outer membrane beta-barrel protein [Bradyrhizobium jicamae]|uniref:Outer membrane beta-barrel protein n=1 Tax=Bradyrhizobium jicamae TaxID=280332 RepID=A0ABS5FWA5_9BRAD|nr:outer membrane beta-barrel protein [Bradyrhizobium jicamae]MBR0800995.1 outer membrane beta-barrel protein [Bradyrhizobium jicamae]